MSPSMTTGAFITNYFCFPIIWTWFYHQVLSSRYKAKWIIPAEFMTFLLAMAIPVFVLDKPVLRFILIFMEILIASHIFFNDSFGRKLFINIIISLSITMCEFFTSVLISTILGKPFIEIIYSKKHDFLIYLIFNLLVIFFAVFFSVIINRNAYGLSWKSFVKFSFFPASQMLIMASLVYLAIFLNANNFKFYITILIVEISICIIADIVLMIFMKEISEKTRMQAENQHLLDIQKLQYEHYYSLKEQQDYIRGLKHDILNHLYTVNILMERGQQQEAKQYNSSLETQFSETLTADFCENRIVDAVLSNKIQYAKDLGIQTTININIPENIDIDKVDLMRVFSNLLDNAIDGCLEDNQKDKFIEISSQCQAGVLIIKLENTKFSGNKKVLSQKGPSNHGLGLKIIKKIVERYDGTLLTEDHGISFLTLVSLKYNLQ